MKFIHAADIHLDSPLTGLSAYLDAPIDLLRTATREAFSNLVSEAIDESVDFVVIAGDLYDGSWKDYNTGIYFSLEMGRLNAAGILHEYLNVYAVVSADDKVITAAHLIERIRRH